MVLFGLPIGDGGVAGGLHGKQARLGGRIGFERAMAVEMVGRDVEQDGDVAIEAEGQVDLVAAEFEDINAVFRERLLRQDGQADVAAEAGVAAGVGENMVDESGGGGFAVGAGDADDLVRRQAGARLRKEFDVADDGDPGGDRRDEQRRVMGDTGGDDEGIEAGEVGFVKVGQRRSEGGAGGFAVIPGEAMRTGGGQRGGGGPAAAGEAVDAVGAAGEGGGGDHSLPSRLREGLEVGESGPCPQSPPPPTPPASGRGDVKARPALTGVSTWRDRRGRGRSKRSRNG